jgi:AraC-like DNA-binding protein
MAYFDVLMDISDLQHMTPPISRPSFISAQVRSGRYLFLDLKPRQDAELAVVCAGCEECTSDYAIERPGFRYHAVEYVIGGCWEFTCGRQRRVLGPGSLFAYGPDVAYTLRASGRSGLVKYFVDFTGRAAPGLVAGSGLAGGRTRQVHQTRWLHDLFDQILDCAHLQRPAARAISARLTELLLLRTREDVRPGLLAQPEAQRTYARCREFIQAHYLTVRAVSEVAQHCRLDPAYLARLFKRFAGESPLQFLTRLRMDHAAGRLMRQGCTVKEAAAGVGFDDPYHFSRVFKRVQGVAPGRFGRG